MNGGPGKRERILLGWLFPVVRGPERRDTRRTNGMPEEMSDRNLSNQGHNIKCTIVVVKNDEIETCYRTSVHILSVLLVSEDCYVAMGCLHPADQWGEFTSWRDFQRPIMWDGEGDLPLALRAKFLPLGAMFV